MTDPAIVEEAHDLSQATSENQVKVDADGIVQWVRHYCEGHGDEPLVQAASQFIRHQQGQERK